MTVTSAMSGRVIVVVTALMLLWPIPVGASADDGTHVVNTLPPVSGVRLEYKGTTYTTDDRGAVTIATGDHTIEVDSLRVLDPKVRLGRRRRAEVGRIYKVGGDVTVTWITEHRVTLAFRNLDGDDVANERVDSVRLKSTLGDSFEVEPTKKVWLLSQRVTRNFQELTVKDVEWTIEDARVDGASVVNRSQQRFVPAVDPDFSVELLFYTAAFTVKDAFFGFPRGRALLVEHPNGDVEELPIDNGQITLEDLPRGDYHVTVLGSGLELERPVAVSRNQDMDLQFYSWLDVGVFFASLAALAVGLLTVGLILRRRARAGRGGPSRTRGRASVREELAP